MIIAQSNSAGTVIGSPQADATWWYEPVLFFLSNFSCVSETEPSKRSWKRRGKMKKERKHNYEITERISQAT